MYLGAAFTAVGAADELDVSSAVLVATAVPTLECLRKLKNIVSEIIIRLRLMMNGREEGELTMAASGGVSWIQVWDMRRCR